MANDTEVRYYFDEFREPPLYRVYCKSPEHEDWKPVYLVRRDIADGEYADYLRRMRTEFRDQPVLGFHDYMIETARPHLEELLAAGPPSEDV